MADRGLPPQSRAAYLPHPAGATHATRHAPRSAPTMPNRLASETSPYLLQHAHNPVDWHPWCDEALALARKHDRPILLSIGYSACHWCHVMERESFEGRRNRAA